MLKSVAIITLVSLLISSIVISPSCSSPSDKPANADEITMNLLQAVINTDFAGYESYFAEELRDQLGTEQDFLEQVTAIKDTYGEYVADSLSYSGIETTEDGQINVYYDAEFTKGNDVQVRSVFKERSGETVVIGFWLERK